MEGAFLSAVMKHHRVRGLIEETCYKYANFGTSYFGIGSGWGSWGSLGGFHKVMNPS